MKPVLPKTTQDVASCIAMVVRNAMEDFHHEHLTDEQMKELNPIIRNAICTALHALDHYNKVDAATEFLDFNIVMIPKYWEPPQLLEEYVEMWNRGSR